MRALYDHLTRFNGDTVDQAFTRLQRQSPHHYRVVDPLFEINGVQFGRDK
jgi:hypothetical protein